MPKKSKHAKPSVGLFAYLHQAWEIAHERAQIHRALRLLNAQTWSIEFLSALLVRAARAAGTALEMELVSRDGTRLLIRSDDAASRRGAIKDDDILQHLDDEVKVNQFISMMQGGGR
jgi:hypothetical protein